MMKKSYGQISIDFLFAMMYLTLVLSALLVISKDYAENQRIIAIRTQERRIAMQIAQLANEAKILSDGKFKIEYRLPKIYVLNSGVPLSCNIDIGANDINVSTEFKGVNIYSEIPFEKDSSLSIEGLGGANIKCGRILIIKNT